MFLDDVRREDSQGLLHGRRDRFLGPGVLPRLLRQSGHPDQGHGRLGAGRQDRAQGGDDDRPRRRPVPQPAHQDAGGPGRLPQVRRRRQGIRAGDGGAQQLLQLPEALVRVALGHKVRQARGVRELLPVPLVAHEERRASACGRLHDDAAVIDAEEPSVRRLRRRRRDLVAMKALVCWYI